MIRELGEIRNEILTAQNKDTSSASAAERTSIDLRINQIQDDIFFHTGWDWRRRTYHFTLRAPYETGTLTLTQNSRSVTTSGTTLTKDMEWGYVIYAGRAYKIRSLTTGANGTITLDAPFPNATASSVSVKIVFPEIPLPKEISSIISVKVDGNEIDVVSAGREIYDIGTTAKPTEVSLGNRTRGDYYNTGTLAVTQGSGSITLTSGTFPNDIVDQDIKVADMSAYYRVKSRDSDTTATLWDNFQGTTASGKSYSISPAGTHVARFLSPPDDYYLVTVEALIAPRPLILDADISLIPEHGALLEGSIYLAFLDFANENPVRIEQARAAYKKGIHRLSEVYKSVTPKWRSAYESSARKRHTGLFDPLDQRGE